MNKRRRKKTRRKKKKKKIRRRRRKRRGGEEDTPTPDPRHLFGLLLTEKVLFGLPKADGVIYL